MEQKKISTDHSARSRELTSWKEIAQHLGVNVRTAQKWERERGLPVRRLAGRRGRVRADILALEAWQQKTASVTAQENRCYRWPLGHAATVEVRFLGPAVGPSDIDLLREYLEVFKASLKR